MKNITKYIIFTYILTFIFIFNVNAECSYQERKDLLNAAKNVDISVEPKSEVIKTTGISDLTGEEEIYEYEKYSFNFIISNLSENLYITYYNDLVNQQNILELSDFKEEIYTFTDASEDDLYTYNFELRSKNENCYGQLMYTKKIVKPIFNNFSLFGVCEEDYMENSKYCKKFITKKFNITENEFLSLANKEKNKNEKVVKEESKLIDILIDSWYIGAIAGVIIIIIIAVLIIRKRRSEL